MSLEQKAEALCRREGFPLAAGCRVLCAVSGGVDSMCLLHLLWRWSQERGFFLAAATFDHQLRPASGEDAVFVLHWCRERGIPCHTGVGDVAGYAREGDMTLEEAGRALRYRFLEDCARQERADYIATAHNADDNAETLLLHLLRGTGLRGLGGIPPRRERVIRPLLSVTRQEIQAYCGCWSIPHREDESNCDTAYTRNYLRHKVMPLLREKNPALAQSLGRTAESLRQDEDFLEQETAALAGKLLARKGDQVSVPAAELRAIHPALAARLVQEMAEQALPGTVLPQNQRQALLELAKGGKTTGKIFLSNRLQGRRVYDMLTVSPPQPEGAGFSPVFLRPGETAEIPELNLEISCRETVCPPGGQRERSALYLTPGRAEGLTVRPRETGDAITLPGRPRKRLKKLLIEAKVPAGERDRLPVFLLGDRVAAVAGFGCDVQYEARPDRAAWQITIKHRSEKEKVLP